MALCKSAELVAVASRDLERCKSWVAEFACRPKDSQVSCYGSYEELLADSSVDAIYLPLPTVMHLEWAVKVAQAGKHLLIEKPVGVRKEEVLAIVSACEAAGVMFMDGVMFMHHPRLKKVEELIWGDPAEQASMKGGSVQRVTTAFSFRGDAPFFRGNIRALANGDPLGCVGDLGIYCIRIGLVAFGYRLPRSVRCFKMRRNAAGVPIDATFECYWDWVDNAADFRPAGDSDGGGRDRSGKGGGEYMTVEPTLHVHCSFVHTFRQHVEIAGGNRRLLMDDFVISDPSDACRITVERDRGLADLDTVPCRDIKCYAFPGVVQEANMFATFAAEAVRHIANPGATSSSGRAHPNPTAGAPEDKGRAFWTVVAVQTQAVLDAVMSSAAGDGVEVQVQ